MPAPTPVQIHKKGMPMKGLAPAPWPRKLKSTSALSSKKLLVQPKTKTRKIKDVFNDKYIQ